MTLVRANLEELRIPQRRRVDMKYRIADSGLYNNG